MKNNPFLQSKTSKKADARFQLSDSYDEKPYQRENTRYKNIQSMNSNTVGFIKPIEEKVVRIDTTSLELFPKLYDPKDTNTRNDPTFKKTSTNFRDAINKVNENNTIENPILPGWIKISYQNGKVVTHYGPETAFQKEMKENTEHQAILDKDLNYLMGQAINKMQENREKYIEYYDLLHGEGAYEEKFVLSPVYHSDSEDEQDDTEEIVYINPELYEES
jgi:hypothetical protein